MWQCFNIHNLELEQIIILQHGTVSELIHAILHYQEHQPAL